MKYMMNRIWYSLTSHLLPLTTIFILLLLSSCGSGDDDGNRLGEVIVGTWLRGWGEGDVVIEGSTELEPENLAYDHFIFHDDGTYNGMVRKGTFESFDTHGDLIFEGNYQCDNHNLKLEPKGVATILAQVLSFTDTTIHLRYTNEEYDVTITLIVYKQP